MDEHTRYRVTGSLFLLAVAVILFPMLFDGAGLPPVEIERLSVPLDKPAVTRRQDVAPETDVVERVSELVAEVDDTGFLAESGTRFGEPLLLEASVSTRVWAVQLASFSEVENAQKLRDQLRGDGYEAFISTVKKDQVIMSRVAVGPLLSRADADNLRDELSASLSLEARIVAFSN
jgi:cell division septation protein DedD